MKKQNGTINMIKFFMAVGVFLLHAGVQFGFLEFQGTWIFVEWFYIFAGYCVAKEVMNSNQDLGNLTFSIMRKRILSIYPYFFTACLVGTLLSLYTGVYTIHTVHDLEPLAADFLMLQMTGITTYSIAGVSWFLSSMWIAMPFVIAAIFKMKKYFVSVLALLIPLLIYGYMNKETGYLWSPAEWLGPVTKGTLRAAAGLCFGVYSYGLGERLKGILVRPKPEAAVTYLFYIILFVFTYKCDDSKWYFLIPPVMMVMIAVTMVKESGWDIPDCPLTRFFGKASMLLFINHCYVMFAINALYPGWSLARKLLFTVIGVCLCAFSSYYGGELLKKYISRLFRKKDAHTVK